MNGNVRLNIKVIEGVSVFVNELPIKLGRKQVAMLVFLGITNSGVVSRDKIVGLLWSGSNTKNAKNSLRQILKMTKDSLEELQYSGLTTIGVKDIYLDPELVSIDIMDVINHLEKDRIPVPLFSIKNMCDSLVQGLESIDPEFDSWIFTFRKTINDRLQHLLSELLKCSSGDRSKNAAQALLNLDATNEFAARILMLHCAKENNHAGSLRVYSELVSLLDKEYGMDPTEETANLAVSIKLADGSSADADYQPLSDNMVLFNSESPPILLIDKFNTHLVSEKYSYIVDGFRHDLIASLVRFRDWHVIELSTSQNYERVSSAANVQYNLRVHTYYESGVLRLVCNLLDLQSEKGIWSQKYELHLDAWFDTQTKIIRELSVILNLHISADRLTGIYKNRELPRELNDLWLLGQHYLFKWQPKYCEKAENIFKQIVKAAPDFAPAYTGLVQLENARHLIFPGTKRRCEKNNDILEYARAAVQLDPVNTKSHLCLAWSYCLNAQYEDAIYSFDSAHSLNENDPWTLISSALGFAFCDDHKRSSSIVAEALALGLSVNRMYNAYLCTTYFLLQDYDQAIKSADKAGSVVTNIAGWKAASYAQLGQLDLAKQEAENFIDLIRGNWHCAGSNGDESHIVDWFLSCFPIRSQKSRKLLANGIALAGLPVNSNYFKSL